MTKPQISIIIPTYNSALYIKETLNKVLEQTFTNWECIIVDDGSSDDTQKIVEYYVINDNRFKFYKRPNTIRKGVSACRNYGLEKSIGNYIQWFDSDDLMHKEKLSILFELIKKNNSSCAIGNFAYFRGEFNSSNQYKPFNNYNGINILNEYVLGNTVINFQSILWDRKSIGTCRLDKTISYAEDVDFIFKQFISSDFTNSTTNDILVYIRKHDNSLTDKFKLRSLNLIEYEIKVRLGIWKKMRKEYKDTKYQHIGLKMYLKSLKYLLYLKKYNVFYSMMFEVFKQVNVILKYRIIKLSILSMIYFLTGKGITAYQLVLNKM